MVLVHGLGVDHRMWMLQAPEFDRSYHVFNWDLPGFGNEPRILFDKNGPLSSTADWLAARIQRSGVENAYLVGYSLGATLAMMVALREPGLVSRLALVAASPRWGGGVRSLAARFPRAAARYLLGNLGFQLRRALREPGMLKIAEDMVSRADREVSAELLKDLLETDLSPELPKITVPTLVVAGGADTLARPSSFAALKNKLRNARTIEFEGGSHLICATHAESLGRAIADFGA